MANLCQIFSLHTRNVWETICDAKFWPSGEKYCTKSKLGNTKLHILLSLKNHRTTPMPYSTQLNYQSQAFKPHWQLQHRIQRPGRGAKKHEIYMAAFVFGVSATCCTTTCPIGMREAFSSVISSGGGGGGRLGHCQSCVMHLWQFSFLHCSPVW